MLFWSAAFTCELVFEREQKHLLGIQIFCFTGENKKYVNQSYFKLKPVTGKRTNELVSLVN